MATRDLVGFFRRRATAGALVLAGVATAAAVGPAPAQSGGGAYTDLGRLVDSEAGGFSYAYAPAVIAGPDGYAMLFCSTGADGAWDWIRLSRSGDGRVWSAPVPVLRPAPGERERAACDPALVRYRGPGDAEPLYYLFYTGSPNGTGAAIFVARAPRIDGPYAKWTGTAWQVDAVPEPVIRPEAPHPDGAGFYGAGQPSAVVREGRLRLWYTDDTGCTPACPRILSTGGADPTRFPAAVPTNVAASSADVTFDPVADRYVMWGISSPYTFSSFLVRRSSPDGLAWSRPEIAVGPTAFVHHAHDVGVATDESGHLRPDRTLVVFGAPARSTCGACWARWDLRGGTWEPARAAPR